MIDRPTVKLWQNILLLKNSIQPLVKLCQNGLGHQSRDSLKMAKEKSLGRSSATERRRTAIKLNR